MATNTRAALGLLALLHGAGAVQQPALGRAPRRSFAVIRGGRSFAVASALPALRGDSSLLGAAQAISPPLSLSLLTSYGPVLATSAAAVAELAVSAGIGFAVVQSELLDQSAISSLAKVVYNLLLPVFLFTSVLRTVTTYGLSAGMLALPLVGIAQILIGLAVSSLSLRACGISLTSPKSRRHIICSSFGNSGVLPLILIEALFRAPYPDASVLPRAASYVSFYLLGWSPVFWSVGKGILTGGSGEEGGSADKALFWRKFFSPPIVGALSGLLAALVLPSALLQAKYSPARLLVTCLSNIARAYPASALLVLAGSLAGGAPSRKGAADAAAAVAEVETEAQPAVGGRELSTWGSLLGIMSARYLLSPAIAWTLILALRRLGLFPSVAVDPVLYFIVLLQSAMPPAQNSVIMLQVDGDKSGARTMSRMLFVLYLLAVVPMSVLVSFFLKHASLCA
jgi:predicted permease